MKDINNYFEKSEIRAYITAMITLLHSGNLSGEDIVFNFLTYFILNGQLKSRPFKCN